MAPDLRIPSPPCYPWESGILLPQGPGEPALSSLWLLPWPSSQAQEMQKQTQGGEQAGRESRGRVVQGHHGNKEGRNPVPLLLHSSKPGGGCIAVPSSSPFLFSLLLSEQVPCTPPWFPSA